MLHCCTHGHSSCPSPIRHGSLESTPAGMQIGWWLRKNGLLARPRMILVMQHWRTHVHHTAHCPSCMLHCCTHGHSSCPSPIRHGSLESTPAGMQIGWWLRKNGLLLWARLRMILVMQHWRTHVHRTAHCPSCMLHCCTHGHTRCPSPIRHGSLESTPAQIQIQIGWWLRKIGLLWWARLRMRLLDPGQKYLPCMVSPEANCHHIA